MKLIDKMAGGRIPADNHSTLFLWPNQHFWWLEITHNSAWSLPFPLPFVELVAFKDSETVTKKASEGIDHFYGVGGCTTYMKHPEII